MILRLVLAAAVAALVAILGAPWWVAAICGIATALGLLLIIISDD